MMPSSSSSSTSSTSSLNDQLDQVTFGANSCSPPLQASSSQSNANDKNRQNSDVHNLKSSLSSSSSSMSSNSSRSSKSYSNSSSSSNSASKKNSQSLSRKLNSQTNSSSSLHISHTNTTCTLCNKRLFQPKLLNCLHTFCKPCLSACLVKNSGDSSTHKSIKCPTCEQETPFLSLTNLNLKGVDTLDDDYVMQNQLDMMDIDEMILDCTSCKTKEKAVARCADCAQFLCPNCVSAHIHMRCFENHKVVNFDEIKKIYKQNVSRVAQQNNKSSTVNSNENFYNEFNHISPRSQMTSSIEIDCGVPIHKPLFCKLHQRENLKFFCNTCQTPICSDCVATHHPAPSHSYERITDIELTKHVEELVGVMRKARENVNFCNSEYKTLDNHLAELQEQLENSRSLIEETFQSYKVLLERKKDDLLKELDEKHSSKELMIMDMHNSIDISVNRLNECVKFTERILCNGNNSEILLLKRLISNQVNNLIESIPQTDNVDVNLKFISDQDQFQRAINQTFGRFFTLKELKLSYLNNLTNSSSNTIINANAELNSSNMQNSIDNRLKTNQQQLQKQYALHQQNPRTDSNGSNITSSSVSNTNNNLEQEFQLLNMLNISKKQQQANFISSLTTQQFLQLQQYLEQNHLSTLSPSDSSNDEWFSGMGKQQVSSTNFGSSQYEEISVNQVASKMHQAISPAQSIESSSSNGNSQWQNGSTQNQINMQAQIQNAFNSNSFPQTNPYQNLQQRVQSPLDPSLNLIKHNNNVHQAHNYANYASSNNSQMSSRPTNIHHKPLNSNGVPNDLLVNSSNLTVGTGLNNMQLLNGYDEMTNPNNGTIQSFNQLNKIMVPQHNVNHQMNDLNSLPNLKELTVGAAVTNGILTNQNGFTSANTPQSPPTTLDIIAAAFNKDNVTKDNQFAGNGNLNPPVRQNGTMTNMSINIKFGSLGQAKSQFNSPHGFCLGYEGEEIIVADTNNHRIQIFSTTGEFKYHFGSPGREEGQLWYPRKVTVMRGSGKFVVCDRGNERSRMQIFSKTGQFLKKISIRYIDIVAGIAITPCGDIVAVDSVSPTIFRITEEGDLIKWFDCSDYMREPSDLAINGTEYFVCDFKGHCVAVFSEEGSFLRHIGGENITNFPNGIDVSDAGDVLVGDSHGNRFHVAVFNREGGMLSEFECPYVKVSRCCGLKITNEGHIVTLAKNNHHVLVLNTLYLTTN